MNRKMEEPYPELEFDAYLRDLMSAQDRSFFETRLKKDSAMREAFEFHKAIITGLRTGPGSRVEEQVGRIRERIVRREQVAARRLLLLAAVVVLLTIWLLWRYWRSPGGNPGSELEPAVAPIYADASAFPLVGLDSLLRRSIIDHAATENGFFPLVLKQNQDEVFRYQFGQERFWLFMPRALVDSLLIQEVAFVPLDFDNDGSWDCLAEKVDTEIRLRTADGSGPARLELIAFGIKQYLLINSTLFEVAPDRGEEIRWLRVSTLPESIRERLLNN
jgi:hypothetical protein